MSVSTDLWSQFTQAFAASMGATQTQATIQVLPNALRLPQTTEAELEQGLGIFLSTLPIWGSAYVASNKVVPSAYQTVLQQIDPTPTADQALKDRYAAQIRIADAAATDANDYQATKLAGWKVQTATFENAGVTAPSWLDYWKNFEGVYGDMLANSIKQSDIAMAIIKAEAPSQYVQAMGKLNEWLATNTFPPPFDYATNPFSTIMGWRDGQGMAQKTIDISNRSTHYDYSKSSWEKSSSTSVFFGIWKKSSHSQGSTTNLINDTWQYNMSVAFESQAVFQAVADPSWFNASVLANYEIGPWVQGSQFETGKSHPWGLGGIFPLQVTTFYVTYNPTITIKLDQTTYNSFKSHFSSESGDGVNFGPFYKNSSSQSQADTKQTIDTNDASSTVTITDTSNVPAIMAVANQTMPAGLAKTASV